MEYEIQNRLTLKQSKCGEIKSQNPAGVEFPNIVTVLDSGKEFEAYFKGAGQIDNLRSYM